MDLSVSPRIRLLALSGLIAALAFAVGMFVLGRMQESSAAPDPLRPASLVKHGAGPAALPGRKGAKPAAKPARKPAARPKPSARPEVAPNGLPLPIASALERHEVVVVSLFAPDAAVARMALKEASAGASLAGAGFVAVNVLYQSQTRPLTALLGVLQDPAVLVFRRPGDLYLRINGFADKETVAQAAANAAPTLVSASGAKLAWVRQVNAICSRAWDQIAALSEPRSSGDVLASVRKLNRIVRQAVAGIRAVKPTVGDAAKVEGMLQLWTRALGLQERAIAALKANDEARFVDLVEASIAAGAKGDAIALRLGASRCGQNPFDQDYRTG